MVLTMDATLSTLLEDIIKDPPGGHVHQLFEAHAILTITDLLQCDDDIVDSIFYEEKGDTRDIYPLKKRQVKNIQNFLLDRQNRQVPDRLDPSAFTFTEVINFISLGGTVNRPAAPVIPASVTDQFGQDTLE